MPQSADSCDGGLPQEALESAPPYTSDCRVDRHTVGHYKQGEHMPNEKNVTRDLLGGVGRFALDGVRRVANEHSDASFTDGFNEAANICVEMLTKNIDELLNKIKFGNFLTEQEQFLLSRLTEMKSATEQSLFDYWEGQVHSS